MSDDITNSTADDTAAVAERLLRYRQTGLGEVQGWFAGESAEIMATLLTHQVATGIRGDIAEIGVHHGKSFLLLANGTRPGEKAVALDVFGLQEKNLDNSGLGDRPIFEANIARFAPETAIEILEMSSLDVTPDTARDVFGELRLMSIDGGHTADITAHDLRLAEAALTPDGVVVLDDVLNAHWLGVATGLFRFVDGDTGLVVFALSDNKLYLARPDAAATYAAALRAAHPDLLGKVDVEFHGGTLDVYGQGSPRQRQAVAAGTAAAADAAAEAVAAASRIRELTAERDAARRTVRAMRGSRSWRLTAPVRALSSRASSRARG